MIRPDLARYIYCAGLCALAMLAAAPRSTDAAASADAWPVGIEAGPRQIKIATASAPARIAHLAHRRAELTALHPKKGSAETVELAAVSVAEARLRREWVEVETPQARMELIDALSDELFGALQARDTLSLIFPDGGPEVAHAEQAARLLTVSVNAAVHAD